jgi:hypothetical protein
MQTPVTIRRLFETYLTDDPVQEVEDPVAPVVTSTEISHVMAIASYLSGG